MKAEMTEATKYTARRKCRLCGKVIMPLEMYYKRPNRVRVHVTCARKYMADLKKEEARG